MPQKSRAAKISIDVGEHTVNIIKTKRPGVIVKAGSAELPSGMPDSAAAARYAAALASAITKAAKTAGIKGGNCAMVVGGPQIITRSFEWPEMPPDALQFNAESEITHYLPSEIEHFIVDYRILRRSITKQGGNPAAQLDVLVVAISKDSVTALLSAAKMAGFSPDRIDIRENARGKLVGATQLWQNGKAKSKVKRSDEPGRQKQDFTFDPNGSFAVLNVTNLLVDMTVFVNGIFYASRYFGTSTKTIPYSEDSQAGSVYAQNGAAEDNNSGLITEIASTIDYIQYRERGFKVESILLFGDEKISQSLMQSLSEYLEIPVLQLAERLSSVVKPSKRARISVSRFMDAFGAATALPAGVSMDLNLKPKKKKRRIFSRFVLPVLCLILVIGSLLAAGLYFPHMRILELEAQEQKLIEELARYTVPGDMAGLQSEVPRMTKMIEEFNGFYLPHSASEVMRVIYGALPSNTTITRISIDERGASLSVSTDTLDKVADFIRSLRSNELFANANAQAAHSYLSEDGSAVEFDIIFTFTYSEGGE